MVLWSRLPAELVDAILEHALVDTLPTSRRWAASLLLISKSARRWLAPRLYHTMGVTDTNAPDFIRLVEESYSSLLLVHTLIFDCGPESRAFLQASLSEARIDILAHANIKRYYGPGYIFMTLALCQIHPGFAPTHIRSDTVNVAALLQQHLSSAFSRLTHLYVGYLSPIWSHQSHFETLYIPPTLRVVILRPLVAGTDAHFFDMLCRDVGTFFRNDSASRQNNDLERLAVRLAPVQEPRVRASLRAWAADKRETRLYITFDAASAFDIDEDSHWLVGEQVL